MSSTRSRSRQDAVPARGPKRKLRRRKSSVAWGRVLLAVALVALVAVAVWQAVAARSAQPRSVAGATPGASAAAPSDPREHRWLGRPLARTAPRDFADRTYLFGSSKNNVYRVHHGVDIVDPSGTPVQAASGGTVVFAGSDKGTLYGPKTIPDFYGNMVLVKLERAYEGKDVYTLYGHFESLAVKTGEQVKQGDLLGKIGMTGTADGPHVHFEVRVGGTTYADSRNPALWLVTLPGTGALAGRVSDRAGNPVGGVLVTLVKDITVSDVQKYWGEPATYNNDPLGQLNSDEAWGENLAVADLPVGLYEARITLGSQTYLRKLTISEGRTTWLEVQEGGALE